MAAVFARRLTLTLSRHAATDLHLDDLEGVATLGCGEALASIVGVAPDTHVRRSGEEQAWMAQLRDATWRSS